MKKTSSSKSSSRRPDELTDSQIDRYSRQIIVPGVGGIAQQRLLKSTLTIGGEQADIAPVLAYLVGAGVGRIRLAIARPAPKSDSMLAQMRELNPDVEVTVSKSAKDGERIDLVLLILGSAAAAALAQSLIAINRGGPVILARLDERPIIAMLEAPPPCASCAEGDLLGRFKRRDTHAGLVTMIAAVATLKRLALAGAPSQIVIEFDGLQTKSHELKSAPEHSRCACGVAPGVDC